MKVLLSTLARQHQIEYNRKDAIIRYNRYRHNILAVLGDKCIRCGFSDIRALQIDHINGKGCQQRKELKASNHAIYRYYIKHIDLAKHELQILCANCNWIKRVENKEAGGAPRISLS